jgi:hypothetical protein
MDDREQRSRLLRGRRGALTRLGTPAAAVARSQLSQTTRVALACSLIAAATALSAALTTVSVADWNITALVRMAEEQPLARVARESDPSFAFVDYDGRGDGVYYYAIARDPLALGDEHELFELSAYRYGHPGYSWAASVLSAGEARLIPYVFLLLNLGGIAVAAGAASLISRELGHSPWSGLLVALNPGLVYATTIDTNEPVSAALLALVLLGWLRGAWTLALPVLAALCFMKEWFVLVPLALAAWELLGWRQAGRRVLVRTVATAATVVPFGLWYLYVIVHFDGWPAAPAGDLLQFPLSGWIQTARLGADWGMQSFDRVVVGHTTVPLLVVVGVAFALGIARALRLRSPLDPVYLVFMPVVFGLNSYNLLYTKDLIRTLAIPLALLPAVMVDSRRWRERVREEGPVQ